MAIWQTLSCVCVCARVFVVVLAGYVNPMSAVIRRLCKDSGLVPSIGANATMNMRAMGCGARSSETAERTRYEPATTSWPSGVALKRASGLGRAHGDCHRNRIVQINQMDAWGSTYAVRQITSHDVEKTSPGSSSEDTVRRHIQYVQSSFFCKETCRPCSRPMPNYCTRR